MGRLKQQDIQHIVNTAIGDPKVKACLDMLLAEIRQLTGRIEELEDANKF